MAALCIQACFPASAPDRQASRQCPGRHPDFCHGQEDEASVPRACEIQFLEFAAAGPTLRVVLSCLQSPEDEEDGQKQCPAPSCLQDLDFQWLGLRSPVF